MIGAQARILLLAAALAAHAAPLKAEQPKADDLRELRQRIDRLKQQLDTAESARAEAADALRESETAISETNRRLRELAADSDKAQAELARISAETRTLQADLDARQRQLAHLLRARYADGERSFLRMLLSGDDPHQIARSLVYHGYLSRTQAQMIQRTRDDIARLSALEHDAREKADELAAIQAQARTQRDALRAKAAERRQVLARVADEVRRGRKSLATAQQNEARLARLVQEIARAVRPAPRAGARRPESDAIPALGAFGSLKGRLRPPVRGELLALFGNPNQSLSPSPKGVFIRAPQGDEVRAIAPGRVVFADWMRGYGNLLIVDHGDGYLSVYGNNESVLRRVGDAVHAGDAVGIVGASGGNDTSGLYFELRHQGKAFDPVPWLQAK